MTPVELLETATTSEQADAAIDAFMERDGDITTLVLHMLFRRVPSPLEWIERTLERREAWFAKRGLPVPEMPGPTDLE
jgi:hypothetical protein